MCIIMLCLCVEKRAARISASLAKEEEESHALDISGQESTPDKL